MAIINVNINTNNTFEFADITVANSSYAAKQGDEVRFYYNNAFGTVSTISVRYFDANVWTDVTTAYISSVGNYTSKFIRSDSTITTDNLTAQFNSSDFGTQYTSTSIIVSSSTDTDPSPITVANVTLAQPSTAYDSQIITLASISTSISVGGATGVTWSKNGTAFTSSATTVVLGDTIIFRQTSSSSYSTSVSRLLSLGDWSQVWTITNEPDPTSAEVLLLGITTPPLKRSDLVSFYGGNGRLSEYYKGGDFIPNISQNINVPTLASGTKLKQSHLLNSGTFLQFTPPPSSQADSNFTGNAKTLSVTWTKAVPPTPYDYWIGYGDMNGDVEVRYNFVSGSGVSGETLSCNAGVNVWSANNSWVTIAYVMAQNEELFIVGNVKIEVRHKNAPSVIITAQPQYRLNAGYL